MVFLLSSQTVSITADYQFAVGSAIAVRILSSSTPHRGALKLASDPLKVNIFLNHKIKQWLIKSTINPKDFSNLLFIVFWLIWLIYLTDLFFIARYLLWVTMPPVYSR